MRTNIRFTSTTPSPCRRRPAQPIASPPNSATRKVPSAARTRPGRPGSRRARRSGVRTPAGPRRSVTARGRSRTAPPRRTTSPVDAGGDPRTIASSSSSHGRRQLARVRHQVAVGGDADRDVTRVAQDAHAEADRAGLRHPEDERGPAARRPGTPAARGPGTLVTIALPTWRPRIRTASRCPQDGRAPTIGEDRERGRRLLAALHPAHPLVDRAHPGELVGFGDRAA